MYSGSRAPFSVEERVRSYPPKVRFAENHLLTKTGWLKRESKYITFLRRF